MTDPSEVSIPELIEEYQKGTVAAGERLWSLYGALVRNTVRRRLPRQLRTVFDSEDFTQQVWASFFQGLTQMPVFEHPAQLVAYLQAMAHNKVVEECRRRLEGVRHNQTNTRSLFSTSLGRLSPRHKVDPTPSEVAIEKELLTRVISELPQEHRRIVELRSNGLTYREIGTEVGMHENSVRRIMSNLYRRMTE